MNRTPEPSLLPQAHPQPALRCCLCLQAVPEALDLPYGTVCRPCLNMQTTDDLSALLCAPIITDQGGML